MMNEKTRSTEVKQIRSSTTKFQTREAEDGKKYIEGYFAVFDSDYELWKGATESIGRHAFDNTIGGDIRALVNHDSTKVLGRTTASTLTLSVDDHGLFGRIEINERDTDATNCHARVDRGDVNQCSMGFRTIKERTDYNATTGEIHWTIEELELFEVSVCTFPAYEETGVSARKREAEEMQKRRKTAHIEKLKERMKKAWL